MINKLSYFILLLSYLLTYKSYSQKSFQLTYGSSGDERGRWVQQTTDKGFIVSGTTKSYGAGNGDYFLLKTDSSGTILWNKTYGGTSEEDGRAVRQTSDGGYIMIGNTTSFGAGMEDAYLIKTDALGNLLWSKTYGGTNIDWARDVCQTSDGGYAFTCFSYSYGQGQLDVLAFKVDATGNIQWSTTIGGTQIEDSFTIEQTTDGGFIVSSFTNSFSAGLDYDCFLIKLHSAGTIQWSKTYGGSGKDGLFGAKQTKDGGYILCGYTDSYSSNNDMLIIKTDAQGEVQWSKTYDGTGDDLINYISTTADGGYVFTAYQTSKGKGGYDILLGKVDASGNFLWGKTFGNNNDDYGINMCLTNDGGFAITGFGNSFGSGNFDAYLIKTDSTGGCFGGCNETSPSFTIQNRNITAVSHGIWGTGGNEGTASTINTDALMITTNMCPYTPFSLNSTSTHLDCYGIATGTASVNISNGTPPYQYHWVNNGSTTYSASGLLAGTYTIVVNDSRVCKNYVDSILITIQQPDSALNANIQCTAIDCFGNTTGSAATSPAGGTSPYNFLWSNTTTNQTATGLGANNYQVTITDKNGCTLSKSITVTEPSTIILSSTIQNDAHCNQADGNASILASGGIPPYQYSWAFSNQSTSSASALASGNYSVVVTDVNLCSKTIQVLVNDLNGPDGNINSFVDVNCFGDSTGSATVLATGGSPGYQYSWAPYGGSNNIAIGLANGTYSITITDSVNCKKTLTTSIHQPIAALSLNILSVNHVNCYADHTGSAEAIITGGISEYTYSWSNGETTFNATGLSANAYSLLVTDSKGCTQTLSLTITQPPFPLQASFSANPISGQIPLLVNFTNTSSGADTYSWFFGDGGSSTDTNPSNVYDNVGQYEVLLIALTDKGCRDTATILIIDAKENVHILFPNIFTPDGNGQNDYFYIQSTGLRSLKVSIYNRWGLKLYDWDGVSGFWEGTTSSGGTAPDGTYYFIAEAKGFDTYQQTHTGYFQLIR